MADNPTTPVETSGQPAPANGSGEGGASEAPPSWFVEFQKESAAFREQVDKRFAGLSTKIRETGMQSAKPSESEPAKVEDPQTETPPAPSITQEQVQLMVEQSTELGEIRASLPESVRAQLDAMKAEDGFGLSQLLTVARRMKDAVPANGAGTPAKGTPPGIAANAAPSTAPRFPKTQKEAIALKKESPDEFARLFDHGFDFYQLPVR